MKLNLEEAKYIDEMEKLLEEAQFMSVLLMEVLGCLMKLIWQKMML